MSQEVRTFTVSPAVIQHLIKSQAGTLAKAIAENVINSVDAQATKVEIELTEIGMVVRDDGHGFRSREEIIKVFEVFGFDHKEHDRQHGRFGLGRGQAWNFASTVWASNTFELDVDIRNRGLDYLLRTDCAPVQGLTIRGTFYKPMTLVEMYDVERDLERLVKYVQVPVLLNGKRISEDPEKGKWTKRTDEAFLRVSEGHYLQVYSQGMYVETVSASRVGVAGVLVTRTGAPLAVNIARNQVLHADCELWKRLTKELKALAGERLNSRTTRMDASARDFLAAQTNDPANLENFSRPIFTLSTGKHVSLGWLLQRASERNPLTTAESGNRMAESLLREGHALPLAPATLERFGAATVAELLATLATRLQRGADYTHRSMLSSIQRIITGQQFKESVADCPGFRQLEASLVPSDQLTKTQRNFLTALGDGLNCTWSSALRPRTVKHREIRIGRSSAADAYTDGETYIALVDTTVEQAIKDGLGGFLRIAGILVHEYAHDSDDAGSHAHDLDFMTAVHDRLIDEAPEILNAATRSLKRFVALQGKSSRKIATQLQGAATQAA